MRSAVLFELALPCLGALTGLFIGLIVGIHQFVDPAPMTFAGGVGGVIGGLLAHGVIRDHPSRFH